MMHKQKYVQLWTNSLINILLVDDNFFNIMILENYLKKNKKYNFNIFKAYNGQLAIEIFE